MIAVIQRCFATATINDGKGAQDFAPVRSDDLHRLEGRTPGSDDVLRNDRKFSWLNAKAAPEPQ